MPLDGSKEKAKVAKLVEVLVRCSSADAEKAASSLCRDPESILLLSQACGFARGTTAAGATATAALAAVQAWPFAIGAGVLTGAGAMAAKRFCRAAVRQSGEAISAAAKAELRGLAE